MSEHNLNLKGNKSGNIVKLSWNNPKHKDAIAYEVERSVPGKPFAKIATLRADAFLTAGMFTYNDEHAGTTRNIYRIREVSQSSEYGYSNIVAMQADVFTKEKIQLFQNTDCSKIYVNINADVNSDGSVAVYSLSGELLFVQHFRLLKGINNIEVSSNRLTASQLRVATVYVGNELRYTGKIR